MASRVVDVFPRSWFKAAFKRQVLDYIRALPLDPVDKKQAYMDWAAESEVNVVAWDVEYVTGRPAGEI
jgi:hypothetical protein